MGSALELVDHIIQQERNAARLPCITLTRIHGSGPVKYMAHASGYVMARRPNCAPFVMSEKEWRALPTKGQTK